MDDPTDGQRRLSIPRVKMRITHGNEFEDGEIVEKVLETHPKFSVVAKSHVQLRFCRFIQHFPLGTATKVRNGKQMIKKSI